MQKPIDDSIGVSIHLNKLLNNISKAIDAMETYNIPQSKEAVVDYGARLGLLAKRLTVLCDECKESLWDNVKELEHEGISIKGDHFVVCLQVISQERFNVKGFKESRPVLFKQWLHDVIVRRATFKPLG